MFSFASSHRRISLEWGRWWFHPTRTILFDVRRACDDSDSKYGIICCLAIGLSLSSCDLDNLDLLENASTHCDLLLVRNCWLSLSQLRWSLFVFSVRVFRNGFNRRSSCSHIGVSPRFFCSVRPVFPTNTAALSIKLSEKGFRNVQHGFLHFCICRTGSPDEIVGAAQDGFLAFSPCGGFLLVAKSRNTSHSSHNRPRDNTESESSTNFTQRRVPSSWRGTDDATRGLDLQVVVRITVFCSAIVIDLIVHCHTAGAF